MKIVLLLAGWSAAASAQSAPCRAGISAETAQRVFAVVSTHAAGADCTVAGVQTDRSTLTATWSSAGAPLPAVRITPRECAQSPPPDGAPFVIEAPAELLRRCPGVEAVISELREQLAGEQAAGRFGSEHDPLFRGARVLFVMLLAGTVALLLRGVARAPSWQSLAVGVLVFAAALVARLALPFSLGNWYSEVLPAAGPPPWMRFGPNFFAAQSLLRDLGLWNAYSLRWSQLLLGAAAVPLTLGVLRELRLGPAAIAATLALLVTAPFHARLSATTSEHVLASTLCLALLLTWTRAFRRGDWLYFAVAVMLFPAVCGTRIDMSVQAALTLVWPILADRCERSTRAARATRIAMIIGIALVALLTLALGYRWIALPSRHPLPSWEGMRWAAALVIPQFWWLSGGEVAWLPRSTVVLAMIGIAALAWQRPLLCLRLLVTVLLPFVVAGRTFLHDELVGARYFLFLIPIYLIAAGYGLEALRVVVPSRLRTPAAVVGIALLALWSTVESRAAYSARYAFQDEYSFLRTALAQLPPGCTVYQEAIRNDGVSVDLDCCLDVARSPLVLDLPALHFADLPDHPGDITRETGCRGYYEGVACALTADLPKRFEYAVAQEAAAHFQPRCEAMHRAGQLAVVDETTTSSRTTRDFFGELRPRVRLYRW